ncbi:MAG: DUF1273 family protein, partial [Firmicutes bacterium]|nr:DUF1273 family protein [Bacillota bacterium]
CCFTGHRRIDDNLLTVKNIVKNEVINLIENNNVRYFGVGGAVGFDMLCSLVIIDLKPIYPDIKLIMVLPCFEQDRFWNDDDKQLYAEIKHKADKIRYVSKEYTKECMHRRNRLLVDESKYCICYLNKIFGGTFYTVNYAREKGLFVTNICSIIKNP